MSFREEYRKAFDEVKSARAVDLSAAPVKKKNNGYRIAAIAAMAAAVLFLTGWAAKSLGLFGASGKNPAEGTPVAEVTRDDTLKTRSADPAGSDKAEARENTVTDTADQESAKEEGKLISLLSFEADTKPEAVLAVEEGCQEVLNAMEAEDLEKAAAIFPEFLETFGVYRELLTSDGNGRAFDAELFYLWLFPEEFKETGKDVLLVGVRRRAYVSEYLNDLKTGEWVKNPAYEEGKKKEWTYAPGFFYLFDREKGECIRMDTLNHDWASQIQVLADKAIQITEFREEKETLPDGSVRVTRTQRERIVDFDENGNPREALGVPVAAYSQIIDDQGVAVSNEDELYPAGWTEVDEAIPAHGGFYDFAGVEADGSVEFGVLFKTPEKP